MDDAQPSEVPDDDDPEEGEAVRESKPSAEELDPLTERSPFPGDRWLVGPSPREVLRRLVDGDPLHLGDRTEKHLRQTACLIPPHRFFLRSLARTAMESMTYQGDPPLGEWLDGCVSRAARDLVREQWAEELRALPPSHGPDGEFYEEISEVTGIEPGLSRLACIVINQLPRDTRHAFVETYLDGVPIEDYADRHTLTIPEVQAHIKQVITQVTIALEESRLNEDPQ